MRLRRAFEILGLRLRVDEENVPVTEVEAPRPFDEVFPRKEVRDTLADPGAVLPKHLQEARRLPRRRLLRLPRWTVAASVMLTAATFALATAIFRSRPILVTSAAGSRGERVAQFGKHSNLDFEAAKILPETKVIEWVSYVDGDRGVGTVLCVELPGTRRLDLCAFGANGDHRWSASRSWDGWSDALGKDRTHFTNMKCLVTRRVGDDTEETVCLVVQRGLGCLILLVDPMSGELDGRCFYPGLVGHGDDSAISMVPDLSDLPRRLLFVGTLGTGPTAQPSVLVLESDATPVQHLLFPRVGNKPPGSVVMDRIHTDWATTRLEVSVTSSEGMFFSFLVKNRLLDRGNLRIVPSDTLDEQYDERNRSGAWAQLMNDAGGPAAYAKQLGDRIRDASLRMLEGWR